MAAAAIIELWANHPNPTDWLILAGLITSAIACTFIGLGIYAFRCRKERLRERHRQASLPVPGETARRVRTASAGPTVRSSA